MRDRLVAWHGDFTIEAPCPPDSRDHASNDAGIRRLGRRQPPGGRRCKIPRTLTTWRSRRDPPSFHLALAHFRPLSKRSDPIGMGSMRGAALAHELPRGLVGQQLADGLGDVDIVVNDDRAGVTATA
jgi:hypothetical protein